MTEAEIQKILYRQLEASRSVDAALPNFYLLMDKYEADLVVLRSSGYVIEMEIKVSRADFLSDLRNKTEKHALIEQGDTMFKFAGGGQVEFRSSHLPNRYYFVCPDGILKADDIPGHAGLIYVEPGREYYRVEKKAPLLHKNKVGPDLMVKMLRSYNRRFWTGF